jgi:hypothetical protein
VLALRRAVTRRATAAALEKQPLQACFAVRAVGPGALESKRTTGPGARALYCRPRRTGRRALRLRLCAGPERPAGMHSRQLRARRPRVHVLLQDLAYGGESRLRSPVHRAAALAVLQGRRGAGGQQQTDHTLVSKAARNMEGGPPNAIDQVDDTAVTKQLIDHLRVTVERCGIERSQATLALHVDVGPSVQEQSDYGYVAIVASYLQGRDPVSGGLVDIGAPHQEQPDYREVPSVAGHDERRHSIISGVVDASPSIEEKLGCPHITLFTSDDERGAPSILCSINSGTVFNQQPCDVDVIQLGGNEEWSRTVPRAMVDVCATLEQKSNRGQVVVLARNIQSRDGFRGNVVDIRSVVKKHSHHIVVPELRS